MKVQTYQRERTALLFIDPYNDFLSDGGKVWPRVREIAEANNLLDNLRTIVKSIRRAGIRIFIVPHKRWEPKDYQYWKYPNPTQVGLMDRHTFEKGTWGGDWHPDFAPQEGDIVVKEHWAQSGFANTDLDMLLKQQGITHVIAVGLLANTCVESTCRFAMELGYHVTLVKDATAAFTPAMMHAAHVLNGPTYAHAITTTGELIEELPGSPEP
ncbi:Nicotinamidase-related amidase [Mucilaginibacter mallensis]|uniref:Nicotinamidase-related amidase n=1 Tax=Mucilaginibacter mallensis TaxID=652787 RepID=A0A1H1UHA1_MUCMA|nr:isochorismatase family cysteine hydrolase [Mucilaginibacter mallensis]SDS71914.1 Nicotinamidase-related amidase [Mucilaginibacter mallensis]